MAKGADLQLDGLVKFFAPRGPLDYGLKVISLLIALGALNWARDQIEHGIEADTYWNNFWEAAIVGTIPTIIALALIWHLNRLQASLAEAAVTDPLTGLPNRRSFFDKVAAELPNPGGVLLMLDADHFKKVNDTYGHGAGDQCLIKIAALLRSHLREGDVVARLGGEEFGVLLVSARREDATAIGARLVEGVNLDLEGMDEPHRVTLSAGAICTRSHASVAELLSIADTALYAAKEAGRARLEFAVPPVSTIHPTAIGPREMA